MKKLSLFLLSFFAVFALGLTGCSDDPEVAPATPVIKATNPDAIAAETSKVKINYEVENPVDGQTLDVKWDVEWLHDLSIGEKEFTLIADANTGESREAKLTLTYPEAANVGLTLRQMSASESISISPKTLSFSYKGGTETVTVTSAKAWTLEGFADWITVDKTEGEGGEETVTFTVSTTNATDDAKTATFNFVCGNEKAPLEVTQNQEGKLIIDEESKTIAVGGAEGTVTVKLQTNIEPVTATIEEGVNWIEAVDTRAMIDKEFSFKVLANTEGPRDATIIFKNADASEQIVIKQAGKELTYPAVIADKTLKTYIMTNFDTDRDGEISKEEAEAVTAMELNSAEITSIDGLEYFPNLESVDFYGSRLLSADFSICPALKSLNVGNSVGLSTLVLPATLEYLNVTSCSKLKKLDLTGCPELNELGAGYTGFVVAPDLSKNAKLESISFGSIKFSTVDVSNNPELKKIYIGGDTFNKLDVTKNPKLESLDVSGIISELDVTQNPLLTSLNFANTKIASIDVSKCPLLRSISFGGTPIVEIDLSKNLMLTSADAYNANQLKKVYLTEGQTIESSMGISDFIVYLPYEASEDAVANAQDETYKAYLLDNFDTDKDGKLSPKEVAAITEINIKGKGIKSLDGVEYFQFTNLTKLDCSDNELTNLDIITFFTGLEELDCSNNKLAGGLSFTKNKNLRIFKGDNNAFTSLGDFGGKIETVTASNNQLTGFTLQYSSTLTTLDISNNSLGGDSGFNIHGNSALKNLNISHNNITGLQIWTMVLLENFDCSNNPLKEIATAGSGYGSKLLSLNVSNTNLSKLDVSGNTSLQSLNVKGCATLPEVFIGTLDPSKMTIEKDDNTKIVEVDITAAMTDENFRKYVVDNFGSDGKINRDQAAVITKLTVNNITAPGVKSLAGINYFPNLTELTVSGLESLDDTDLSSNLKLTSVSITLEKGMTKIITTNLAALTTFSLEITGSAAEKTVGPTHIDMTGCVGLTSLTAKNCRELVSLVISDCAELEYLNLSGSFVKVWLDDEEYEHTCSISIYNSPKLIDPEKFIPAANLSTIWATVAQMEAFKSYFSENYDWGGGWQTI
ncbi:leucine-rich repeat domain-containing protein [Alistipes putredinis]|uniref:leucine-rich repeat domain-containing protein n=1 Tax=Alistipes putredinis TaxID=28117 RepID=UPI0024B245CE|nr:leucine-rich repeat domain-containing protein [Alistipes putredinis]